MLYNPFKVFQKHCTWDTPGRSAASQPCGRSEALLLSSEPVGRSSYLHKIEHKSFIWVIFWLFPHLPLEMKPRYNGFLDSPTIFDEINHQPRTAPRPLQDDALWSVSHCLSGGRRKKNLFD